MTALRLFTGSDSQQDRFPDLDLPPEALLTVREYYETRILPIRRRRRLSVDTLSSDRTAIARWERYGGSFAKDWERDQWQRLTWRLRPDAELIRNPPIGLIVDDDLELFFGAMSAAGLSDSTINTTRRHLMPILNHAAPRESGNRGGTGAILSRPWIRPIETELKQNWIPTAAEVRAFVETAQRECRYPTANGPACWRALIRFLCNYGLRREDMLALMWFENIKQGATELLYRARKTARRRPHPTWFPINGPCSQDLMASRDARRLQTGRFRVFYWATTRNLFEPEWKRLAKLAGVSRISRDAAGREIEGFNLKALRRFCNHWHNTHSPGNPGEFVLNHGFTERNRVNHEHYSLIYRCPPEVERAILELEQPF